jgi:hypothetical protein
MAKRLWRSSSVGLSPLWGLLVILVAGLIAVSQATDYTISITLLQINQNCQLYALVRLFFWRHAL